VSPNIFTRTTRSGTKSDSEIAYQRKHLLLRMLCICQMTLFLSATSMWHVSCDWRFDPRDHTRRRLVPVDLVNTVAIYRCHGAAYREGSSTCNYIAGMSPALRGIGCAALNFPRPGTGWLESHRRHRKHMISSRDAAGKCITNHGHLECSMLYFRCPCTNLREAAASYVALHV